MQMLSKVVRVLDKVTKGSQHNPVDLEDPMDLDELESEQEPEFSDDDNGEDSPGEWSPRSPQRDTQAAVGTIRKRSNDCQMPLEDIERIRLDLRKAKEAGFRVGHLGGLLNKGDDCFVTISCRVAKLGISDEALQAWHLEADQYFILVIRYKSGYRPLERLLAKEIPAGERTVEMQVGVSQGYKIKFDNALDAFIQAKDKREDKHYEAIEQPECSKTGLGPLFIGRPLNELMNGRLLELIRYRISEGFPWDGAENFYNDHQGRNLAESDVVGPQYWADDASKIEKAMPDIVTADHLISPPKAPSFPLVAMQFALRHLVRCTEFCLVCHCKVETEFEALKPFVCSKPLCLYQYMTLGFGPSIEHEILSQPHVVDLLVSFCYCSAANRRLTALPIGMGLIVPHPSFVSSKNAYAGKPYVSRAQSYMPAHLSKPDGIASPSIAAPLAQKVPDPQKYKARFDRQRMELIFLPGVHSGLLRPGHWIYLTAPGLPEQSLHCRVIEALYPTIRLAQPVVRTFMPMETVRQGNALTFPQSNQLYLRSLQAPTPVATPPPRLDISTYPEVEFAVYDQNFDDLDDDEKQRSLCVLLNTLPSIKQMKEFLESKGGKDMSLRAWADRVSTPAAGLLRWIIASNRSCIVQVDNIDGEARKAEERVTGMSEWMQFRFAQGAPDKEQRFVTAVSNTTRHSAWPTLFAWHGSPLPNWHSIVREGLHFEQTANGRAYGHGVYHSLQLATSLGYTFGQGSYSANQDGTATFATWPHSELKISQAITLNEIVNAPAQFVSSNPHLVVAQLDWIQSRYLFVKCNVEGQQLGDKCPSQVYEQDPKYIPTGANGGKVAIPITAISKSRRPVAKAVKSGNKKAKIGGPVLARLDDVVLLSDDTDAEDLEIFFSDVEEAPTEAQQLPASQKKGKMKSVVSLFKKTPEVPKTDFVPGTLDHSTLQILEPPIYATSSATKQLQRELTSTLKVQDTHPAHELGWYIDSNLITNVYQWIIELHSFEPHLPLAKDMKAKDLKRIVMEMRFGKDYPMSPPFVRIIRPRFLSFMQGGGGHVTAGGALCMELLTNSGWSAVSNIESVLLQVRLAISATEPKPARLEQGFVRDYGVGEAVEAYIRACNTHGVSFLTLLVGSDNWV